MICLSDHVAASPLAAYTSGVFVIAEAGVNHNGSTELALELVDVAAAAGADAVKFQTFRADSLAARSAKKAAYQQATTGAGESQHAMLRALELSPQAHRQIVERCRQRGIRFMSSPFDIDSLQFLVDDIGVDLLKLGSGEITNGPLLLAAARSGKPLILSSGMATLGDIERALAIVAWGLLNADGIPPESVWRATRIEPAAQAALAASVVLLHCTTEYPAPLEAVNLRAMATLAKAFGIATGYSDHTLGINVSIGATALGAVAIEKHFTLDRQLPGPDHRASLEPDELKRLVTAVREIEFALGQPRKQVTAAEYPNRAVARKSVVAATDIAAGEVFTTANLAIKRPGDGVDPCEIWRLLGTQSPRAYVADELIDP